ncbi:MAG: 2-dehydropantoate 2-reductase [Endozoicomonas sp.]
MTSIAILGAGCIGCHLAGQLMAAGTPVRMIGRTWFQEELSQHGLTIVGPDGNRHAFAPQRLDYQTEPTALEGIQLVILCVKSGDLGEAGQNIARYCPDATVICLQNGLRSASLLQRYLPADQIVPGSVVYSVNYTGAGVFKKTEGRLHLQVSDALKAWLPDLDKAFGKSRLHDDISAMQWSKLLLNLNNSVNAVSGLPLVEQLKKRRYRKLWADCMSEGMKVMKKSGVAPVDIDTPVPLAQMPFILKLPDFLFRIVASRTLKMDPEVRMSMWADLQRGRPTEIDELNGEVLQLAYRQGMKAEANQEIYDAIKRLEKKAG